MRRVAILLFHDVEVLDACGPFEVFATTCDSAGRDLFQVFTVAATRKAIRAVGGLVMVPDYDFGSAPAAEIVLVPGGNGRKIAMHDTATLEWVRHANHASEMTLSVCTGAFILASAGVLPPGPSSTHHSTFAEFDKTFPRHHAVPARYTQTGKVITAAGISAGIDMSLHVVELLHGAETAQRTARRMEWEQRGTAGKDR